MHDPHHQQQQQQASVRDAGSRLDVLENIVAGINGRLNDIVSKLDARSGINWAPIGLLITVLGMFGGMGFTWINMGQTRLESMIAKQEIRSERYVPREDLDTRFHVVAQRRDDLQKLTDDRIARIERDLDGLQKNIVPRGEHEQTWAGQRSRDDGLQRQLDQARKDLSDLNTPRDTIQSLQRRIEDLDQALRSNARR
ncbi:hypothetical protein [Methylobacterium sp. J-068]|uniref:hypothetical protein n=1 Tax=Methylobacterium sp. J-068 TaxID=2836649 RepID=UPI001FBACF13|nr:hypothetical protein [Methylobacterium sp. J-068]MCJ2037081.1 hypothetical protein [Methylobacterium sp. J-068]